MVACQYNKHLVTTLISPLCLQWWPAPPLFIPIYSTDTGTPHTFMLLVHTLTLLSRTYTQHSHPQTWHLMVTLKLTNLHATLSYTGTMLCVKRRDPDGSHLVCVDGLLRWLRTGYGHLHRWRPTDSGQEMDVLTIDLLRSMTHNLVIWHWGCCTHWAGTLAWHIWHITASTACLVRLISFNSNCHFRKLFLNPGKWIWIDR